MKRPNVPDKFPYMHKESVLLGLTPNEALLYSFIYFRLRRFKKFYYTNKQLAFILNCSTASISKAIARLKQVKAIKTKLRLRAGGGTIRFINECGDLSQYTLNDLIDDGQIELGCNLEPFPKDTV